MCRVFRETITGINKKLGPGIDTRCFGGYARDLGHTERHRQAGPSRVAERHPDRGPSRACPSEATARPVPGPEEERPRQLLGKGPRHARCRFQARR